MPDLMHAQMMEWCPHHLKRNLDTPKLLPYVRFPSVAFVCRLHASLTKVIDLEVFSPQLDDFTHLPVVEGSVFETLDQVSLGSSPGASGHECICVLCGEAAANVEQLIEGFLVGSPPRRSLTHLHFMPHDKDLPI